MCCSDHLLRNIRLWLDDEEPFEWLPIWKLLSEVEVDSSSVEPGRFSLTVDNGHAFEEVFQLSDVLFDCYAVLQSRRAFHRRSDFGNSIEPETASIALHTMAQRLNSPEVLLDQSISKYSGIFLPVI